MKAVITVNFKGIEPKELERALQSLRDLEQIDSARIQMVLTVDCPDMSAEEGASMLASLKPPLGEIRVITRLDFEGGKDGRRN